jgi:anti-sigma regulatory factor (Ser/Thr protein kinase)
MRAYRVEFRGTPSSVCLARETVVDYARLCGFTSEEICEIALATGEALANAVEHGNKDLGFIAVSCTFEDNALTVEVSDAGAGFDISRAKPRPRDPEAMRGFGMSIMHALMHEVAYSGSGNVVTLMKRRAQESDPTELREEA